MIIRSLARRSSSNVFQQCLVPAARCRAATPTRSVRNYHSVPTLSNHHELQQNGIPGLFTAKGFDTAYTQYQKDIIEQLNVATSGTPLENKETKDLITECARDPVRAYLFNIASMAFNNHFFFKNINTNPNVNSTPPTDLVYEINKNFTSMETFKQSFLDTAEVMFGPGFVWLVQHNNTTTKQLSILTTYLAGSPLSGAHYRRQEQDMNSQSPESYQPLNRVGAFGRASNVEQKPKKPKKPLGGVDVSPLLCVNTWEHVWLHDYGITGKRQYLEAWWDKIDWNKVTEVTSLTSDRNLKGGGFVRFYDQ
ncbi:manganese and iron superoxide dismutase [Byssothecium circinans]|uniref:Manganese and iron superoxide dismutase n=1 Tax=Byssothecium circinans TaxID=147558 RepID=A0A6A5TQF2_9PLEO|nr:manganese and iron superoxide dismutase [Byssothecium circinans]